jgi:zinc D-Ala-D-Ala carboxypeptidase|tara:strand:- start:6627 stop:6977 length:351 start_codon:yes stop_codon:yes gene_type:complete
MNDFKYFKLTDFDCQETGENEMDVEFIKALDHLRAACGFPFIVTSGYRSKEHSVEKRKPNGGGVHTKGIAADIKVSGGAQRLSIVKHASAMGMSVGVAKTFVHVDVRKTPAMCWCY